MKELRTKSFEFNCDFCVPFTPRNQLFIRVSGTTVSDVANAFSNSAELEDLSYCGKKIEGFSKLEMIRNEGSQIFISLE